MIWEPQPRLQSPQPRRPQADEKAGHRSDDEDSNLIRRPLVVRNTRQAIFGFDAEAYDRLK
jgi:arsenate reductase-like glutaredoxin family protein